MQILPRKGFKFIVSLNTIGEVQYTKVRGLISLGQQVLQVINIRHVADEGKYKGLLNFGRKIYRNAVTGENKEKKIREDGIHP